MRYRIWEQLAIFISDAFALLFAFLLAYFLRLGTFFHSAFPFLDYVAVAFLMIPLWLFLLIFAGRYSLKEKTLWEDGRRAILASLAASLLFPLVFYFKNELFFSRGLVFLLFAISTLFLWMVSFFFYWKQKKEVKNNKNIDRLLVIGADRNAERVIKNLLHTFSRRKPVAILAPYGTKKKEVEGVLVKGKLDALERVVAEEKITTIFLCEGAEHSLNIASFCQNNGIFFLASVESFGLPGAEHLLSEERIGNIPFLCILPSRLFGWGQFSKRFFDFLISSLGIFFFFPFFLAHFSHLKTVKKMKDEKSFFDAYVFEKDGKIFGERIASLLNVWKKEMSIVGPKTLSFEEFEKMETLSLSRKKARFVLRPGIFSPSMQENGETEITYTQTWSFGNDLKMVWKNLF